MTWNTWRFEKVIDQARGNNGWTEVWFLSFYRMNKKIYIHPAIFGCTHINLRLFLSFFCSFFFFNFFFLTEEPCNKYSTQESKTSCDVMSPHLFCFVLFFFINCTGRSLKKSSCDVLSFAIF